MIVSNVFPFDPPDSHYNYEMLDIEAPTRAPEHPIILNIRLELYRDLLSVDHSIMGF